MRTVALLAGLMAASVAWAAEPVCDPLALDLTRTPQRTQSYPGLRETVKVQAARPARAEAVLIGDSLLAGWRTDLPAAFPATAVYDFSVGGDRVANVLWRLDNTDLSPLRPSVAALLIGTNDLAAGTPACAVAAGIAAIVERLRVLWPDTPVFVLTIPPRGRDFHEIDAGRLEVNAAILSLGNRLGGVHAVKIDDDAFTCGRYGNSLAADRQPCGNYADDNLHFSARGYVELGRILRRASADALGENVFR
ncbi:GDSL-type esterase/lipase family protein [Pleomorphomonas koreensis]|uniref:GDSL-type esterase/lipase family protein n=1 Tax=Pleomorphomonas koreensis TaxID=257440 RepID=UPI00041D3145|nr:GDSL-type esterase/lipase family protein [Pleomorphomonas koreensis]